MLSTTPAIVLHRIRHRDKRMVVTLYTELFGPVSVIFYQNARNNRSGLTEPLNVLEVILKYQENRGIQEMKDIRLISPLNSIRQDIRKSTLSFFLAELMLNCTRHTGQDGSLFTFLLKSVRDFEMDTHPEHFHLRFITALLKEIGIGPVSEQGKEWFNPSTGSFQSMQGAQTWSQRESDLLKILLAKETPQFKGREKSQLTALLVDYLGKQLHFTPSIQSLSVLEAVYH